MTRKDSSNKEGETKIEEVKNGVEEEKKGRNGIFSRKGKKRSLIVLRKFVEKTLKRKDNHPIALQF